MKKNLLLILIQLMIFQNICLAEEEITPSSLWGENSSVLNSGFENQKPVSNSKLQKAIDAIKQNQLSRKQRQMQQEVNPLSPSIDTQHLENFVNSQDPDNQLSQTLTVLIPVEAYDENGKKIAPGYYKLACRKIFKDTYVLELSQGTQKILEVKAMQTEQDLEQDTIQFCNAEIIDNHRVRLMYGSLDLNLVGYLYFKE